jgi:hypothetical protein
MKDYKILCRVIEKYGSFEIEWLIAPELFLGKGHGVEFFYKKTLLIGFIEGFAWHHKQTNQVRIYALYAYSDKWGAVLPGANKILGDLRECVHSVLKTKQFLGTIKKNISVHANG